MKLGTKIFFVMDPIRGGGPRNVFTISRLLCEEGYQSKILAFHSMKYLDMLWRRRNVFNFYGAERVSPGNLFSLIDSITSFSDNLNLKRWPVFIFQQYFSRPSILYRHEIPDVYVATSWQSFHPTLRASGNFSKPMAYFVQGDETEFSREKIFKREVLKTYRNDVPKFTQSRWLVDDLREKFGTDIEYIGFGVDHNVFYPRDYEKEKLIFTIARSEPTKGFSVFANAVNRLWKKRQDFKVVIAGHKSAVVGTKMNFPFEYLGWITDDELMAKLYTSSIFVNTGVNETLPMPPLEAMACGGAVVMTANGGSVEYARDLDNCVLAAPGNDVELADKLDMILSSDSLRESLRSGAMETAKAYNWTDFIKNFKIFIEKNILKGS
ncbi:lipopolysaccharide 1,2-N-acetylglucosaminetransferase [Thermoplasmatales archaeon]|nr:lipopolysaccharide 1,2-N-acetylglucosaminetransferase [Thermoplasmatales archaeon]